MSDNKKSLDEIIEQFNTEVSNIKPKKDQSIYTASSSFSYTYTGEHYDTIPSDSHWTKQFVSTELAVNITDAISYAVRDGLDNSDVAVVLDKILNEVKNRQK